MATQETPKTCRVITAETISKNLLTEVKETLAKIQGDANKKPTLAAFLANEDPAANMYAQWSKKTCEAK
jgi:methylenetetrahydrofolate dehydrogenase (NAD+)